MSSKNEKALAAAVSLEPLTGKPIPFLQFLSELKEHPERALTAAGLIVGAVKKRGLVNDADIEEIQKESPDRARYLRMLKAQGIPLYKAFMHVRGSQRTVARIMKFLESAASNGYQLRQLLVIIGGPGSGKSYLMDAFKSVLEGEEVYVVQGCPVHENPLNLLKLLKPEQIKELSAVLDAGDLLDEALKVAGEPCEHCWSKAMESADSTAPSLANVMVQPVKLSSRKAGIATWMPSSDGQGCDLLTALRQGSRGMIDMPEAFAVAEPAPGQVLELDLLLDATEYRRIPSMKETCSKVAGTMPLDALLMLQSNEGAFRRFIKAQADPKRFMRRAIILGTPYNTAVCEEVQAYLDFINVLKARPHIDPLALRLAATLAVASRMKKDSDTGVSLDVRIRMYNGENLFVAKRASSISRSNDSDRWSSGMLSSLESSKPADGTESRNVNVTDLWDAAGEKEAMEGLSVPLMLSAVSQVCELSMNGKGAKQCIPALSMLGYLRARIEMELQTPELQDADRKVLENCREFLKELKYKSDTPSLVEKEYRRLLREQILRAFAPDYENRAELDFEVYRTHAKAAATGADKVFDKRYGKTVEIDSEFLESLERLMGKTTSTERNEFRQALETELSDTIRQQIKEFGSSANVKVSWRTLPALRIAIAKKLDEDIAKDVERCLTDEMNLNSETDRKLRQESLERFESLGYCQHCTKKALAYIKDFKLWSLQS